MKERDKERETKNSKREWGLDREKKTERGRGSKRDKSKTAIIQYYNLASSFFSCNKHFYSLMNSSLSLLVNYPSFSISPSLSLSLSLYLSIFLSISLCQSSSPSSFLISLPLPLCLAYSLSLFISLSLSVLFSHYYFCLLLSYFVSLTFSLSLSAYFSLTVSFSHMHHFLSPLSPSPFISTICSLSPFLSPSLSPSPLSFSLSLCCVSIFIDITYLF